MECPRGKFRQPLEYQEARLVPLFVNGGKVQRDQQGLKLLAANDSKIFPKYEIFLCVSIGTRCKL
jgi:hypothetical protein